LLGSNYVTPAYVNSSADFGVAFEVVIEVPFPTNVLELFNYN
jgi:hypothetical protein